MIFKELPQRTHERKSKRFSRSAVGKIIEKAQAGVDGIMLGFTELMIIINEDDSATPLPGFTIAAF